MKQRGFSLIEMMMTTSIVAMLSSIALPSFQDALYKTKLTERTLMIEEIERAVFERMEDPTSAPSQQQAGFGTSLFLPMNPPAPIDASKRRFDPRMPGWRDVGIKVSGDMYFRYTAFSESFVGQGFFVIFADSDLDSDGQIGTAFRMWEKINGRWQMSEWVTREY